MSRARGCPGVGRVQRVGYRDHVFDETFGMDISGYVKNLDTGEVEIVAEGQENDLLDLIRKINIIQRPIAVQSFRITWEEPTGAFRRFEIIRGDIQDETFDRMDYAGKVLHSIDRKMDTSLDKQDRMLEKQDQMLEIGKETKEEIFGLRKDTRHYPADEFKEIKKKLSSIEDALVRAGIQVYYSYEIDSLSLLRVHITHFLCSASSLTSMVTLFVE